MLVLHLVEDFEGRSEDLALSRVDSLKELLSHVGESLIVCLRLDDEGVVRIVDFIVKHVIVEGCEFMLVLFVLVNRVDVLAFVSLVEDLVDVSIRDVSVSVDLLHVLLQRTSHCLLRFLPYQVQTVCVVVSK